MSMEGFSSSGSDDEQPAPTNALQKTLRAQARTQMLLDFSDAELEAAHIVVEKVLDFFIDIEDTSTSVEEQIQGAGDYIATLVLRLVFGMDDDRISTLIDAAKGSPLLAYRQHKLAEAEERARKDPWISHFVALTDAPESRAITWGEPFGFDCQHLGEVTEEFLRLEEPNYLDCSTAIGEITDASSLEANVDKWRAQFMAVTHASAAAISYFGRRYEYLNVDSAITDFCDLSLSGSVIEQADEIAISASVGSETSASGSHVPKHWDRLSPLKQQAMINDALKFDSLNTLHAIVAPKEDYGWARNDASRIYADVRSRADSSLDNPSMTSTVVNELAREHITARYMNFVRDHVRGSFSEAEAAEHVGTAEDLIVTLNVNFPHAKMTVALRDGLLEAIYTARMWRSRLALVQGVRDWQARVKAPRQVISNAAAEKDDEVSALQEALMNDLNLRAEDAHDEAAASNPKDEA